MATSRYRGLIVYLALALAVAVVAAWQTVEHRRVQANERQRLLVRARDITNTIGLICRTNIPGFVRETELRNALRELVDTTELTAVALLNADGDRVLTAGDTAAIPPIQQAQLDPRWDSDRVTIVNPVDFGVWHTDDGTTVPIVVMPPPPSREEVEAAERERDRDDGPRPNYEIATTSTTLTVTSSEEGIRRLRWLERALRDGWDRRRRRGGDDDRRRDRIDPGGEGERRAMVLRRPPWMDREEFEELTSRQGLHAFVLVVSNEATREAIRKDRAARAGIGLSAALAAFGLGLLWNSRERASRLQLRLLRAQELNTHLRELNIAAAGLAHETRNPLNIVRGLAQMIAQNDGSPPDDRDHARQIADEVDRVTGRLNAFIAYSKPIEPRHGPVRLESIVADVRRALHSDLEDRAIELHVNIGELTISADEALLRQVLFNLLLNAAQAIDAEGRIEMRATADAHGHVTLEVADDGPGIEPALRQEVFRPYFTLRADGSGLGLAVVRQIVLAHGWEIEALQNAPEGALFRLSGIRTWQDR